MSCNYTLSEPDERPFRNCDGSEWSDEFLRFHLDLAIETEHYQLAIKIRDEFIRRKIEKDLGL